MANANEIIFDPAPAGSGAVSRTVEAKARETDRAAITDYGASSAPADDTAAFQAAFAYQSASKTLVRPGVYEGIGKIVMPKGGYNFLPLSFGQYNQVGMEIEGDSPFATTAAFNITSGAAFLFRTYSALNIHDFYVKNTSPTPGTSVAINLDGTGGGENLTLKRLNLEGFHTAIRTNGQGTNPGNGDKTLVEQVTMSTTVGFDQTRNNQAYGWTFLNTTAGCENTHFLMSGAGETLIVNHVGDIHDSFMKLPESSGNPGSGVGTSNYFGQRITAMSTKLEYSAPSSSDGQRRLIDARESVKSTDSGGSNCDIVLREVSIASGTNWPDPATNTIIEVGNATSGSDSIRIKQEGGTIEGRIKVGSVQYGGNNRRWSFRDAVRAPNPETVSFLGEGNHYLMEWRANENVPIDQYRGGQGYTGSIDAQKAFLWRQDGKALINTGITNTDYSGRKGGQFAIPGFPGKMTATGLAVFINENVSNTDTLVEWFSAAVPDANGVWQSSTTNGSVTTQHKIGQALIPGSARGLVPVVMNDATKWQTLSSGQLLVRLTKPGFDDNGTQGHLVLFYFPYMGT